MSCARPNTPRSDAKDWGQLEKVLRDRLWTMAQDYGLYPVSLYRDPGRQWDLRHERVPGHECDPAYNGFPTTAVPAQFINGQWVGGSKHQHRKAGDVGGSRLAEAYRDAWKYGLKAPVRGENWHFEVGSNSPSVPIREYPGKTYESTPATPGWQPPVYKGILKPGVKGEWVREWALLLKTIGYNGFFVSGTSGASYGAGKVRATKRFQKNHGLKVDGIVGPATHAKAVQVLRSKRAKAGLPV